MTEAFDPYHKWLGIPPKDQPPNHYRLLGIDVFETDRDVIDSAANQRMAYLQDLATGPDVAASQKLLNEVSLSRRSLLNPETKETYDQELRAALGGAISQFGVSQPAVAIATDDEDAIYQRRSNKPVLIQTGVATVALIVVVILALSRGESGPKDDASVARQNFKPTIKTGIVLDWPLRERTGALVYIDGQKKALTKTRFLQFNLSPGNHTAVIQREDYRENRIDVHLDQDQVEKYRLHWERFISD